MNPKLTTTDSASDKSSSRYMELLRERSSLGRLRILIGGLCVLVLIVIGGVALVALPERAMNVWFVIGPIIAAAIAWLLRPPGGPSRLPPSPDE